MQADAVRSKILKKDAIESELLAIADELHTSGVGLKGNLIDKEGYPRDDVDVMRVATLRNRHAVLNTDLSVLMKEIENCLYQLHAQNPHVAAKGTPSAPAATHTAEVEEEEFLRVNSVAFESPASSAGLREHDLIYVSFFCNILCNIRLLNNV
jgi:26S proteasome non-ATPase regulatory subunit 9